MTKKIIWFRNDLRVDDNPALLAGVKNGAKHALFFDCEEVWRSYHWSDIKIDFIRRHLTLLAQQLAKIGVQFEVVKVINYQQQIDYFSDLIQQQKLNVIFANQELELNEEERDKIIMALPCDFHCFEADVIAPKGQITTIDGNMYRVFTPFKKAWLNHIRNNQPLPSNFAVVEDGIDNKTESKSISSKWPLANIWWQIQSKHFFLEKVKHYHQQRDFPYIKATSGLSPYLAIGAISARRLFQMLLHYHPNVLEQVDTGAATWLNELIWRDFYRHLLFAFPELIKGKSFQPKYQNLIWPNHQHLFNLWRQAKTGFPIIDAAMMQLKTTGWMHNRLRMIVASFLTKNLLVHWRLGEQFFMQHLIDGDFAANNGGWQWAASTGCDAQPYFRVFNPVSQSKKFDPEGHFIRKYIPSLENVPNKYIHEPHEYLLANNLSEKYWAPIVDLKLSRQQAIMFYGMKDESHSTSTQTSMVY